MFARLVIKDFNLKAKDLTVKVKDLTVKVKDLTINDMSKDLRVDNSQTSVENI